MTQKDVYLSVDIDYWNDDPDITRARLFLDKLHALPEQIPVHIVEDHQDLLAHINSSRARILYNIDYHADLHSDDDIRRANGRGDYNWAGFVEWKQEGTYVWYNPNAISLSNEVSKDTYCYDPGFVHRDSAFSQHAILEKFGWGQISRVQNGIDTIDLLTVLEIGIAISPNHSKEQLRALFGEFVF